MSEDKVDTWKSPEAETAEKFAEIFRPLDQTEPKAKTIPGLFRLVKEYIFKMLKPVIGSDFMLLKMKNILTTYMSYFLLYNKTPPGSMAY